MELMHNQAIRITGDALEGIYRVILDEPLIRKTVLARLDGEPVAGGQSKGGRKRLDQPKSPRKKPRLPNVGALIWLDRDVLEALDEHRNLHVVEIENRNVPSGKESKKHAEQYHRRVQAMASFLSIDTLREHLIADGGVGRLVQQAMAQSELSKSVIYGLFSRLCRLGFSEKSLRPDYDRCGAPSVPRPCDPGGRKKAGAKTIKQRIARHQGVVLEPDQPGISTEWKNLILAADAHISTPKPPIPDRVTQIHGSAFITRYRENADGRLVAVDPGLGTYPNSRQVRRVLERHGTDLERLLQKTTSGHFDRALRGLIGKSWKGVAGPGHTWAIDSTVGDMYLRSSINRAWIIGRPIVYVIVDVWSTAVVGFYVCLRGPSWDMAKIALFCAGADPSLVGSLWDYIPILSLNPAPTLPARLLCDRGEYLSRGAKLTGMTLLPCESYTPPYRPDLKGMVEVLHRIKKDKQYHFVPGAIDARRAEYELRRFDPTTAVLTVTEYVRYLYIIFSTYNLTAPREHRLDAHMKADGVFGSPAGLWNWGHQVGIGIRRSVLPSDLVTTLLPEATATVSRDGVVFGGRQYESELVHEEQWTAQARNFGGWEMPCWYFPGSVSRIWTPHKGHSGVIDLSLSDQSTASPELTWDEVADADQYYKIKNAEREHQRTLDKVTALRQGADIVEQATTLTKEALAQDSGPKPTTREAREAENAQACATDSPPPPPPAEDVPSDDVDAVYSEMMATILAAVRAQEQSDG